MLRLLSCIATLIFCHAALLSAHYADVQREQRYPNAEELWENIRLVHVTDVLRNHTIVPGTSLYASNQFNDPNNLAPILVQAMADGTAPFVIEIDRENPGFHFFDVHGLLPRRRITSHWHLYEPIP